MFYFQSIFKLIIIASATAIRPVSGDPISSAPLTKEEQSQQKNISRRKKEMEEVENSTENVSEEESSIEKSERQGGWGE